MSCAMEAILAALLPLTGPDYAIYKTPLWHEGFEKVLFPEPVVCDAASLIIASNRGLAPSDTEVPIIAAQRKLSAIPSIQTRVRINRSGPFYGYYIEVLRSPNPEGSAHAQPAPNYSFKRTAATGGGTIWPRSAAAA